MFALFGLGESLALALPLVIVNVVKLPLTVEVATLSLGCEMVKLEESEAETRVVGIAVDEFIVVEGRAEDR